VIESTTPPIESALLVIESARRVTVDGYSSVRYELPTGSCLVWTPPVEAVEEDQPNSERDEHVSGA
jgi:hypothetical protein